jgi:Peptidase family M23
MQRRALLKAGAIVAVGAPFFRTGIRNVAAPSVPTADGTPARTHRLSVPGVAQDGAPPHFGLSALAAYQGGALRVSADSGLSGTAYVFDRPYQLAKLGPGLAGFVGFGTEDPPGAVPLSVYINDAQGMPAHTSWLVTVLKTNWTVDHIVIPPPDPNAPPPPPGLVDEQPRLNELYSHLTARKWRDEWKAPLPEPLNVSGYFGEQRSFNGGPVQGHHGGTDLAATQGTPIYATNDGTVVMAERVLERGNCVVLDHGSGVFSCYGHQSEMKVVVGQVLTQGETLGLVGTTGLSTGPHLHWEMSVGGVLVDGLRWLDGTQGF